MLVETTYAGPVAVLTLNRPPANALSPELLIDLKQALEEAQRTKDVRCIMIAANGKVFSAGADLKVMAEAVAGGRDPSHFIALGQEVFEAIVRSPKPTLAAVQGGAFGGGLELAMSCDLRVVADGAKMGQPEINLGILPGWGGTQRLPRLVGRTQAMQMLLTGEPIDAREALRIGLVNQVVEAEELQAVALRLCQTLADRSAAALAKVKETVLMGDERGLQAGLLGERVAFADLLQGQDGREGVTAFLEKRRPQFNRDGEQEATE